MDGSINPHNILEILAPMSSRDILLDEVQKSTGFGGFDPMTSILKCCQADDEKDKD